MYDVLGSTRTHDDELLGNITSMKSEYVIAYVEQ